jgi:hypothetical protein
MAHETVTINNFVLRIAGLNKNDANDIGHEVATKISDVLSVVVRNQTLGALKIRVNIPSEKNRDSMASIIANSILKGIL